MLFQQFMCLVPDFILSMFQTLNIERENRKSSERINERKGIGMTTFQLQSMPTSVSSGSPSRDEFNKGGVLLRKF